MYSRRTSGRRTFPVTDSFDGNGFDLLPPDYSGNAFGRNTAIGNEDEDEGKGKGKGEEKKKRPDLAPPEKDCAGNRRPTTNDEDDDEDDDVDDGEGEGKDEGKTGKTDDVRTSAFPEPSTAQSPKKATEGAGLEELLLLGVIFLIFSDEEKRDNELLISLLLIYFV